MEAFCNDAASCMARGTLYGIHVMSMSLIAAGRKKAGLVYSKKRE
jgi:hypothetical protein